MRAPKLEDLPKGKSLNPTAKYGHLVTALVGLALLVLKHTGVIDANDAAWLVDVLDYVAASMLTAAVAFLGLDAKHARDMERKIDDEVRKHLPGADAKVQPPPDFGTMPGDGVIQHEIGPDDATPIDGDFDRE